MIPSNEFHLKRDEFEVKKAAIEAERLAKRTQQKAVISQGRTFDDPLLCALAEREEPNRQATMNTIIFIRDVNSRGQEISGYIDYAHRLKDQFQFYYY